MKICFKCKTKKPLEEFYKHPQMKDGRLNKCKECTKRDVSENYSEKRNYYAEYEKERYQRPERKKYCLEQQIKRRKRYPDKYRATSITSNAIRGKRLIKQPCEICGEEKVEAHHDDYSKPLDVRWLCRKHHLEAHGKLNY